VSAIEALGIDRLSVVERLELIEQIWDTLPQQVQSREVPPWHLVELARRREEAENQPGLGAPWREVLAPAVWQSRIS
jgi:putative addiction module component (TIGR02574 family)